MKVIKKSYLILLLIFVFNIVNCHLKPPLFKCVHSEDEEKNALPTRNAQLNIKQNEAKKRRVESEVYEDGFKDFHIYLDLENIKYEISQMKNLNVDADFFINSMQKAVKTLESLLKVKPLVGNYYLEDSDFGLLNISKWNTSLFGTDAKNNGIMFNEQGIDLVIFGTFADLGESTLATASAKAYQNITGQPYIGLLKINKDVDYTKPHSEEYFQSILVHEFTHILGFSKHFFEKYYHNLFWKIDDLGYNRTYLNSTKVVQVAKKYFNCEDIDGVELENQGGSGTSSSHWEARILLGEYMNGYSYTEEQVISEFTLAVLEDSGYYKANYYTGGLMRFGKNKGCQFLKNKCVDKTTHKINEKSENEFYDDITYGNNLDASCSSGRQSRTYYAWYLANGLPEEFQYFENPKIVGYEPADYCPVALKYQEEEDKSYYVGHCSSKGSGEYGSQINYIYSDINPLSKYVSKFSGESFSDHSFCFLSSLIRKDQKQEYYSYFVRANCYEIFCSEKSLTVKILDDYIVCPRAGGKIVVDGFDGFLLCPDYNLMCSGTKMCNDMFDCVEKKSEIKETSYNYDYEIKTSQSIPKYKNAEPDDSSNYELSTDGICTQYCQHCKANNTCLKCSEGYGLTLLNNEEITCTPNSSLSSGYFKNEQNIYIKCIDNCDVCLDLSTCSKCHEGFIYSITDDKEKCTEMPSGFEKIDNCLIYAGNNSKNCEKCEYNHGFNQTKRDKCLSLTTDLPNYYTKNGIYYYPCAAKNPDCERCTYDDERKDVICTKCVEGKILVEKGNGLCTDKNNFENNNSTKYFQIDETHYGLCSDFIENCISCEDAKTCNLCLYKYEYNNITNKCHLKEKFIKQEKEKAKESDLGSDEELEKPKKGRGVARINNDSNGYFSIKYILLLETIYILFLLIKF